MKMPGQATGGARRLPLTVAAFRPWRGSQGFAAPGLPGRNKHTRCDSACQSNRPGVAREAFSPGRLGFPHFYFDEFEREERMVQNAPEEAVPHRASQDAI